jgi:hypothetical protein
LLGPVRKTQTREKLVRSLTGKKKGAAGPDDTTSSDQQAPITANRHEIAGANVRKADEETAPARTRARTQGDRGKLSAPL